MEYHNFVPITADLTGAADAYNQCHYQVSSSFISKSGYFFGKVDVPWKTGYFWVYLRGLRGGLNGLELKEYAEFD